MIRAIWRSMRPHQWFKNFFIFAPALFTLDIFRKAFTVKLLVGFIGFSLISSAIYIFNDIKDREEDRLHPVKRFRPIASGQIPLGFAALIALFLFLSGLTILYTLQPKSALVGIGYVLLMVLYNFGLRKVALIDTITISVGFVLRVVAGGTLIQQPLSHWLLLCTFTLALYLSIMKRRQETVVVFNEENNRTRQVLFHYPSLQVMDGWCNILAGMSVIFYALYTVDPQTIAKHHTDNLIYTVPFVIYGVFRYQKVAYTSGSGEDPARLVLKDPGVIWAVILWTIVSGTILYYAHLQK